MSSTLPLALSVSGGLYAGFVNRPAPKRLYSLSLRNYAPTCHMTLSKSESC